MTYVVSQISRTNSHTSDHENTNTSDTERVNRVAESLAAMATLILRITGEENLNREGERMAVESIDITMLPEAKATPEIDLHRALLSENQ